MPLRWPLLRPALVWALAGPLMAVATGCALAIAPFRGRRRAFWIAAPPYIRFCAWCFGLRRILLGWEALPEELREGRRPAIYIANHTSLFDPPLLISTLPARPVFVAKRELARVPVLGLAMRLAGFIFVERGRAARALESIRNAALRIREGQSVVAFPEGTRSPDGRLLPFKSGAFRLAWEAQVPVVPLGIRGGHRVLPKGSWRVAPSDYEIRVGIPLEPRDFPRFDTLRDATEAAVRALLEAGPAGG